MPEFKVRDEAFNEIYSEFAAIEQKMVAYSSEIRNINRALSFRIKASYALSNKLNLISTNASKCANKVKIMSQALQNIHSYYIEAENKAKDAQIKVSTNKGQNNVNESIRDIFKGWEKMTELVSKIFSKFGGNIDSKFGDFLTDLGQTLGLAAPIIGYMSNFNKVFSEKYENGWDAASAWLSLVKSSSKTETSLYKFFLKTLEADEGLKLYNKLGGGMTNIGIAGSLAGFISDTISTVNKAEQGDAYENTGNLVGLFGKGIKVVGDAEIASKFSEMVIKENTLVNAAKIDVKNANAYLSIITSGFDAVSSGIKKYGEVMADGRFDGLGDAGQVGIAVGVNGLISIIPGGRIVEGIVDSLFDVDANDLTDYLIKESENLGVRIGENTVDWMRKYPGLIENVRDIENPFLKGTTQNMYMLIANVPSLRYATDAIAGWMMRR